MSKTKFHLATTTGDLNGCVSSVSEAVAVISGAGFKYLDLDLYSQAQNGSPILSSEWESFGEQICLAAEEYRTSFIQSHAPSVNCFDNAEAYERGILADIRSIELCGKLGIGSLVVHSGFTRGVDRAEYFKVNRDFFRRLLPTAEKYGVKLCVENSSEGNMGDMWYFFDAPDMNDFIASVDHPLMAACWDTGHANMRHMDQGKAIRELGGNLAALHIQDNFGVNDDHIAPYQGTTDFIPILQALCDIGYDRAFAFEANNLISNPHSWPNSRSSMTPNIEMRKQAEKLLYVIGCAMFDEYEKL